MSRFNVMREKHHELSPSSFPAWNKCPGWDNEPNRDHSAADKGTNEHMVLSALLIHGNRLMLNLLDSDATSRVLWAEQRARELARGDVIESERRVIYSESDGFAAQGMESRYYGTSDIVIIHPPGNTATIIDYKSGNSGLDYEAQLAGYALALFSERQRLKTIHGVVLYGGDRHIISWTFTRDSAAAIVLPILEARQRIERHLGPCEYCAWCRHSATCSAVLEKVGLVISPNDQVIRDAIGDPGSINDPIAMGQVLDIALLIDIWVESVRTRALAMAENDRVPEGYRIQKRRGRRALSNLNEALVRSGLTVEQFQKACSVSLPKLTEQYASANGISNKAQAQKEIEIRLGDVIEETKHSISLVKE